MLYGMSVVSYLNLFLQFFSLICEQKTSVITPNNMKLIDALSTYFVPTGALSEHTFEQLHEFSLTVYDRYMCSASADDAEGHFDRDTGVYGEPWRGATVDTDPEPAIGSSLVLLYGSAHNIFTAAAATTSRSKPKRIRTTANAQPARNFSSGDQAMITQCNTISCVLPYGILNSVRPLLKVTLGEFSKCSK
jgi:hypothetical protein